MKTIDSIYDYPGSEGESRDFEIRFSDWFFVCVSVYPDGDFITSGSYLYNDSHVIHFNQINGKQDGSLTRLHYLPYYKAICKELKSILRRGWRE